MSGPYRQTDDELPPGSLIVEHGKEGWRQSPGLYVAGVIQHAHRGQFSAERAWKRWEWATGITREWLEKAIDAVGYPPLSESRRKHLYPQKPPPCPNCGVVPLCGMICDDPECGKKDS